VDRDRYVDDLNRVLFLAKEHQKLSGAVDRERRQIYNCIVNRKEKIFVDEFDRFRVVWLGQVLSHLDSWSGEKIEIIDLSRDLMGHFDLFTNCESVFNKGSGGFDWGRK